jgi:hypothetical protein
MECFASEERRLWRIFSSERLCVVVLIGGSADDERSSAALAKLAGRRSPALCFVRSATIKIAAKVPRQLLMAMLIWHVAEEQSPGRRMGKNLRVEGVGVVGGSLSVGRTSKLGVW